MEFIIFAILILLAIGTLVYGIGVLVLGGWPYCVAIALAGIIVAIIGAVSAKKIKDGTTHEHEEYINAYNADKEAQDQYERNVKAALNDNRDAYARKERVARERSTELQLQKSNHIRILSQLPGLAQQDKNKHAVTAMISYLERGKADSIKEALNLYDREERERAEHIANNQILWQMQQQAQEDRRKALERMEEEQRRHNDAMRESEKKRNEKIDEAIRDMKDSLRQ